MPKQRRNKQDENLTVDRELEEEELNREEQDLDTVVEDNQDDNSSPAPQNSPENSTPTLPKININISKD